MQPPRGCGERGPSPRPLPDVPGPCCVAEGMKMRGAKNEANGNLKGSRVVSVGGIPGGEPCGMMGLIGSPIQLLKL